LGDRLNAANNQAENRIGHALIQSFCMVLLPFDAQQIQQRPYCSTLKVNNILGFSKRRPKCSCFSSKHEFVAKKLIILATPLIADHAHIFDQRCAVLAYKLIRFMRSKVIEIPPFDPPVSLTAQTQRAKKATAHR
jgi:hypothetical protein